MVQHALLGSLYVQTNSGYAGRWIVGLGHMDPTVVFHHLKQMLGQPLQGVRVQNEIKIFAWPAVCKFCLLWDARPTSSRFGHISLLDMVICQPHLLGHFGNLLRKCLLASCCF